MLNEILKLCFGILVLYVGAEGMVRGSKRLAITLGIHPLVIGLTIVAFGTSMPELVVTLTATYMGSPSIALGNIIGSNIANMGLILGLSALISPLRVEDRTVRLEVPIAIFSGILLFFFAGNLEITLVEGIILIFGFIIFFFLAVFPEIAKGWRVLPDELTFELENPISPEEIAEARANQSFVSDLLLIALGIAGMVLGADFTVSSAVYIALDLGISEMAIGATIIALGTSLPELATSIVAAIKNEPDISVGNVIGSNLFNTLIVAGTPALVMGYFPIENSVLIYDFPIMIGLSILLMPLLRSGGKLDRKEGLGIILIYVFYIVRILTNLELFIPIGPNSWPG